MLFICNLSVKLNVLKNLSLRFLRNIATFQIAKGHEFA